jgi:KaiC/GvpD/RAD55 family RecA-like ATPase
MVNKPKKTGIDGLDSLLSGGLVLPPHRNFNILTKGSTGTCKTILSLQIAINLAKQGIIGIYYSMEQPPEDIRYVAQQFNWLSTPDDFTFAIGGDEINNKLPSVGDRGALLVCHLSRDHICASTEDIQKDIQALENLLRPRTLGFIVVDSINAIGKGCTLRENFRNLLEKLHAQQGRIVIIVLEEKEDTHQIAMTEEFLVDAVIRLGCRYRSTDYSERYLDLIKVRNQFHYRGQHSFLILSSERAKSLSEKYGSLIKPGIQVFPSMPAKLAEQARKQSLPVTGKRLKFNIPTLDRLLHKLRANNVIVTRMVVWPKNRQHFLLVKGVPRKPFLRFNSLPPEFLSSKGVF